jgi:hypothetical protein
MKKIILSALLIFGLLIFIQIDVLGCTCDLPIPKRSLKQQVNKAWKSSNAVFSGRVLEITKQPQNFYVSVRLLVVDSWKGNLSKEITITTGLGNGDCGYPFEVGESYLIYANGSDENKLSTGICHRTNNLLENSQDLKILGKGKLTRRNKS